MSKCFEIPASLRMKIINHGPWVSQFVNRPALTNSCTYIPWISIRVKTSKNGNIFTSFNCHWRVATFDCCTIFSTGISEIRLEQIEVLRLLMLLQDNRRRSSLLAMWEFWKRNFDKLVKIPRWRKDIAQLVGATPTKFFGVERGYKKMISSCRRHSCKIFMADNYFKTLIIKMWGSGDWWNLIQ